MTLLISYKGDENTLKDMKTYGRAGKTKDDRDT
jgi:hypothetical protein